MAKIIAHRGFAKHNTENSFEAFRFAAASDCYGIETDVHKTRDGVFVCFHDDNTLRIHGQELIVSDVTYPHLQKFKIPTLAEYIDICANGNKVAVVELKNPFPKRDIKLIVNEIRELGYLDNTIFISFVAGNIIRLRRMLPHQQLQFITAVWNEKILRKLARYNVGLDIEFTCLSKQRIAHAQSMKIQLNCWTLNDPKIAKYFADCGIDYITTDTYPP